MMTKCILINRLLTIGFASDFDISYGAIISIFSRNKINCWEKRVMRFWHKVVVIFFTTYLYNIVSKQYNYVPFL